MNYIKAHWIGELSLAKSALINGVLLYLAFFALLVSTKDYVNTLIGLSAFAIYFIWALVGMLRSGWRVGTSRKYSLVHRTLGWLVVAFAILVFVVSVYDLGRIFGLTAGVGA